MLVLKNVNLKGIRNLEQGCTSPHETIFCHEMKPKITVLFILLLWNTPALSTGLAGADDQAYQSSKYKSAKWDLHVKEGMKAFHADEFDVAQTELYKAFNLGCESPIVLFQLALINEYKKNYYSALEFYQMAGNKFQHANRDHRYNKTFTENYGRALYMSGKKDQAIPLLFKAAKHSNSYWLLKLVGMISYERGDSLNALSYFERAVRVKTPDVTNSELIYMYTLLAKLFGNKSEFDGAQRYYRKVIDLDPTNSEANNFINGIRKQHEQNKMHEVMEKLKDF